MAGSFKFPEVFRIMRENPREGISRLREMYSLFAGLPPLLQEEFFGIVSSYPCTADLAMDRGKNHKFPEVLAIEDEVNHVVLRILNESNGAHQKRYLLHSKINGKA